MGLPEEELADRARNIFDRLRAERETTEEHAPEESPPPPEVDGLAAEPVIDEPAPVVETAEAAVADAPDFPGVDPEHTPEPEPEPEPEPDAEPDLVVVDGGLSEVSPAPAEEADLAVDGSLAEVAAPVPVEEPAEEPTPEPQLVVVEDDPAPDPVPEVAPPSPAVVAPPPLDPHRFARPLPRVLAIANQKGGVGKTTTAVNLGAGFAELGYRVLVVDLDPQGNATTGLGVNSRNLDSSIYDVILHDTPLEDCVEPTAVRNLFVAPATIDLAGAEIELVPAFSRELRLRRALETVSDDFDFVLIDCPPSLGLLTINGLAAATEVVVPIQCEYYALEGLGQLLRNVNLVQGNLNPKLELSAIVLTMYDARTKLAEAVADDVRQHFGPKVCRNVVPRTVRLSEAPSFGQPIMVFDPSSRGAIAYRELAKEVSGGTPKRTG